MEQTLEAKRAAAVAAVYSYLTRVKAGGLAAWAQPGLAGSHPSLWALYGRQALMNQRVRMQAGRKA